MIAGFVKDFELWIRDHLINVGEACFCFDQDGVELLAGVVLCFGIGHLADEGV